MSENVTKNVTDYVSGGNFEMTIGNTCYEVVMNFREKGAELTEKALRVVRLEAGKCA